LTITDWQWLSAILAAPVACSGWPFHQAAWANLRHRAAKPHRRGERAGLKGLRLPTTAAAEPAPHTNGG